jgi:energy-coupling factor transport system substrate-specific component
MAIVLGPVLLFALYPRVKRWGLLWTEIMNPDEVSASRLQTVGNVLVWVGSLGGVAACVILSLTGVLSGIGIGLALIPFVVLIVVGSFMLGGREQVEAIQEETVGAGGEESRA